MDIVCGRLTLCWNFCGHRSFDCGRLRIGDAVITLRWPLLRCTSPVGVSTTSDLGDLAEKITLPWIGWSSEVIQTSVSSGMDDNSELCAFC